jgi:hypothetical protein
VEVAMVMTLTLTLMTLMAAYFVRGQRYAAETETYSSVQRSANTLLRKMTDDIYRSSVEQIEVGTNRVIFLSFGPTDDNEPELELEPTTGKIVWKKWVGYYHDVGQETVFRGELPLDSTISDLSTAASPAVDLLTFPTLGGVSRRPLPGKVRSFSVTQIQDRIRLRLTTWGRSPIVANSDALREVVVSVQTEVALLN